MLELKDICFEVKENKKTKHILKNINLVIEDDKFFVITGPNGSGKSTLAKIIMGINKPTSGKIFFNGKDITSLSITERAKLGVSFAFQQPVRFKGITVKQMIEIATGNEISAPEACKYLSDVGLCARDYIDREIDGSLSGGELKRIEVASLLIRELKLAMYDEPEAGIDMWSFNMLVNAFKSLGRERSGSLLIISHQERLMQLADRIAVIADGKVKEIGTREKMLPLLTDLFSRECIRTK